MHGSPVQGDSLTTAAGESLDREPAHQTPDYERMAKDLDRKSPLEIMDQVATQTCPFAALASCCSLTLEMCFTHFDPAVQALKLHGDDIGIAFSGAEDVALVEYAHLTGRPYRVFR